MLRQEHALAQVKRYLWLYFWLLIFEGALRKWIVPSLSSPLLIVRDPVAIIIYFYAKHAGVFPKNGFIESIILLALLSFMAGLTVMISAEYGGWIVPLFGFRANFLHLPLIFIFPMVMGYSDLIEFGRLILIVSVPMAALMVLQYLQGTDGWLNVGAGGIAAGQIEAVAGKIRPAGTFSFVSGPVNFFSLVTVFVLHGVLQKGVYPLSLVYSSGFALASAMAVSGSRSAIYSAGIVVAMLLVAVFYNSALVFKAYRIIAFAVIIALLVSLFEFFSEGVQTTTARFQGAHANESFNDRMLSGFLGPIYILPDVPILGYGLGVGTNAGAVMLTGSANFLLAEGEWFRVILESGPILGTAFLLWRLTLMALLALNAVRFARRTDYLPLLLLGACGFPLVAGQFGQATSAGFAVLMTGLCLLSCKLRPDVGMAQR
jgi:hypothetical protein